MHVAAGQRLENFIIELTQLDDKAAPVLEKRVFRHRITSEELGFERTTKQLRQTVMERCDEFNIRDVTLDSKRGLMFTLDLDTVMRTPKSVKQMYAH